MSNRNGGNMPVLLNREKYLSDETGNPMAVIHVGSDNFQSEILREERPVFLACIHREYCFREQTADMSVLAEHFGEALKVCILENDFSQEIVHLRIQGTPTYILYHGGEEIGRLLGKMDGNEMEIFISDYLAKINSSDAMMYGRN